MAEKKKAADASKKKSGKVLVDGKPVLKEFDAAVKKHINYE